MLGKAAYGKKNITGNIFPFPGISGNTDVPVFPFYDYAKKYNFGEYIPKDQGGRFIQAVVLNSNDDFEIVKAIRSGALEKVYGSPISWDKYEKTEIEKSVWLNRFYYLPSFARAFYITGDTAYLRDMMAIIRQWNESNPLLPDSPKTTYNWRDMQVAWRTIHLSWCYYLGGTDLREEDKKLIEELQKKHSEILLSGFGTQRLNEFNHQSHGGLAMLYAGILFPSSENSKALIEKGLEILNHHLDKAFFDDGGNVEHMFGYYPFEMHIFRDAYLLCTANGVTPPEKSVPMLQKMVGYLLTVSRPDGTVPEVNDSFPMPVEPSCSIVCNILRSGNCIPDHPSVFLQDSQIAVIRSKDSERWYLLANPASVIGGHSHAGRLGFELWYMGKPVIIDSGCCDYDDELFVKWFRTSRAHNTALIDGISDKATSLPDLWALRRETGNKLTFMQESDDITSVIMESPADDPTNSMVKWTRVISMIKEKFFIVSDYFDTDREHTYDLLFHFPSDEVSKQADSNSLIINKTNPITLTPVGSSFKHKINLSEGLISNSGFMCKATMAEYSFRSKSSTESHVIITPMKDESRVRASLRKHGGNSFITIKCGKEAEYRLSVNREAVKLVY